MSLVGVQDRSRWQEPRGTGVAMDSRGSPRGNRGAAEKLPVREVAVSSSRDPVRGAGGLAESIKVERESQRDRHGKSFRSSRAFVNLRTQSSE